MLFSGLAPGTAGYYQLDVHLPASNLPGDYAGGVQRFRLRQQLLVPTYLCSYEIAIFPDSPGMS